MSDDTLEMELLPLEDEGLLVKQPDEGSVMNLFSEKRLIRRRVMAERRETIRFDLGGNRRVLRDRRQINKTWKNGYAF